MSKLVLTYKNSKGEEKQKAIEADNGSFVALFSQVIDERVLDDDGFTITESSLVGVHFSSK